MTKKEVMELLATAGDNLMVDEWDDHITVTVEDFLGFDEDWNEVDLEYDEDLVDEVEEKLSAAAISSYGDYYTYYEFDGFMVIWGLASFDI